MKKLILALALVPALALAGPQQERMKTCNAEAKGKKGDERKAFMKTCLSGGAEAPADKAKDPKQRMKDCNMQAKGKKGDDRKAFMSTCLKNN